MKPKSKITANEIVCIGRSIQQVIPSTSCWPPNGTATAALRFFRKAICHHGEPEVVSIDKSGANTAALAKLNADKPDEETITVRKSKYLNKLIEQDHRNIKRRIRPMLGFKSFRRAQTITAGIEMLHMIGKGQYQNPKSGKLSPAEQFYFCPPI